MIVITQNSTYGIYKTVEELDNFLLCDGTIELPKSVIGAYEISIDDSLMPVPIPVVKVPESVTRRQAIQELIDQELDDAIIDIINSIPNIKQRKLMRAWYEESQVFERDRPELNQMWELLGKTQSELDATFISASKR